MHRSGTHQRLHLTIQLTLSLSQNCVMVRLECVRECVKTVRIHKNTNMITTTNLFALRVSDSVSQIMCALPFF